MPAFRDRSGERYGRLVAVAECAEKTKSGRIRWLCRCDCGNECVVTGTDMVPGRSQSCGCLQRERASQANTARTKHGHSAGRRNEKKRFTPTYYTWKNMRERCSNLNAPNYHLYGGRGIRVCEEWNGTDGFNQFLAAMGERPDGTTIDRIDSDGNYEPGNVRWATAKEQARNRRDIPDVEKLRRDSLDRGRTTMWSTPAIREKLIAARRAQPRDAKGRILPSPKP